jgi:carotenoid cleavage dioxygenase
MFERDLPARYGILPRHGSNDDIKWFEMPAHYVFHTSNAYEDGDEIVLHACRLESTNVLQPGALPKGPYGYVTGGDSDPRAVMHRWRFNLETGAFKEEQIDDIATDFPRIDDALVGHGYRYSYNARFARNYPTEAPAFEGVNKYDLKTGKMEAHLYGKGRYGGEPVFVPAAAGKDEDDGWVVTFVQDEIEGASEMVVLDAKNIAAAPVARVMIPTRVPYGFHGAWISDGRIESQRQHQMAWSPSEAAN